MEFSQWDSLYRHGFARVAVGVPRVRVAHPAGNAEATIALAQRADAAGALLVAFPELGISSYSADDLFHQQALLESAREGLEVVIRETATLRCALVVGAPLIVTGRLFNCAVIIRNGAPVGVVPKSYLPNYREFYEKRQFSAARDATVDEVTILGQTVPFGTNLLFNVPGIQHFTLHVEICEDLWVPAPPSSYAALAGATVLVNLSASNALVAKGDYRRLLCASQSARCLAAYLYTASGTGESTTDLAWDGHALIHENGDLLAEAERFAVGEQLLTADLDLERLVADRLRMTSFGDNAEVHRDLLSRCRHVELRIDPPPAPVLLEREINRFPYVPPDPATRNERCAEVVNIQVEGLANRLGATGIEKLVVGVSGGLDSTHALIVAAEAMDRLGLPRQNVLGVTMPGFATSAHTLGNARRLMAALGVDAREIDIRPSAEQMLKDLDHPAAHDEQVWDITYENVQAGERTSHLFRLANYHGALVVGTGDLSELALGWCTFGVGDHMAHYSVNASVPKTLIRFLIDWTLQVQRLGEEAEEALRSILATEISPELIPPTDADSDLPAQSSEAVVGPFELADFFLYYVLRYGYRPSRVAYLALQAWGNTNRGRWADAMAPDERHEYDLPTIKARLGDFLLRFVEISQFKRSTLPNAPKVGSGGSLSPRGDWRAPSDASARPWLEELERGVPDLGAV